MKVWKPVKRVILDESNARIVAKHEGDGREEATTPQKNFESKNFSQN